MRSLIGRLARYRTAGAARRDPAPSRLAYRLHRLWLTPALRRLVLAGLPLALVGGGIAWYLSEPARLDDLRERVAAIRSAIEQRPEFMVRLMEIRGASEELSQDIREITALDFPLSSFDLDLDALRARIQELDAVASASLSVQGGVLRVIVTERIPAIVWRDHEGLELLDAEGHRVASIDRRGDRADLPLIAGEGAEQAVPEALSLYATLGPLLPRVRGLLRVGARRWDVVLDRDQRIMLPETGAVAALERALALDAADDILARDVVAIDLRDGRRPTLRLGPTAVEFLREIRTGAVRPRTTRKPGEGDDPL